jgi:signal transduction histidine kinase
MRTTLRLVRLLAVIAWSLPALCVSVGAEAASPKRVLLIYSYGRDVAPFDSVAAVFRTELARGFPEPIVVFEATLDAGLSAPAEGEQPFLAYLKDRYAGTAPDLVVTLGAPAARFYLDNRDRLFPATPLVMASVAVQLARSGALRANDEALLGELDFPGLFDNILQLLPDTKTIAVILGASALERFWLDDLKRELAPLTSRVNFLWLNDLSLEQIQAQVANLPAHSAVFYCLLAVDAAGVPHPRPDALAKLHTAANAPIFGLFETDLGNGVVGGPLTSQRRSGEQAAAAALRALSGAASAGPQIHGISNEPPVYDWRELTRWNIDRARLPPGSEVRFVRPSLWDEHRIAILATTAALALQAALITGLWWQLIRRRAAEREARGLGGRLLTAHEDERRRLARELHDDVTQRLAALAIEAAGMERDAGRTGSRDTARSVREGLVDLSEDVHALSYRLHPSVIEDLGLVEALKAECDRIARVEPIRVHLESRAVPAKLPSDTALCVFRVAQEALRNVVRHAKASDVEVSLHGRDGGLVLAVRDNGAGFDRSPTSARASLGLASMRERVRLLGGSVDIESGPGRGTAIVAWVPLREAA